MTLLNAMFSAQTSPRKRLVLLLCTVAILYLYMVSGLAHADDVPFPVLNRINDVFAGKQGGWYSKVYGHAVHLFWLLVSVDFAWSGVTYVLEKNDIGEIAVSITKKILTIGFYWALLKFSSEWIPAIINSFSKVGMDASGASASTPDGIAAVGFNLAVACFKGISELGALDKIAVIFPVTVVAIVMFLAYLFVAAQLLVTLIETYLAIGGGVILLGFGGSRWTTDLATKYLQYAVSTGLKLMMIYMIVGMGNEISGDLAIVKDDLINSCLKVMGVGLVYAYLAIQIPAIASAMISGSPSLTAGGFAGTALTLGASIAGGAAATQAAASGAGSAMGGAAAGATGLGKALSSGLASASDFGKTGMDAAAHATGAVVGHGLGMAASAIGSAVSGAAGSFGERVDNSTGGQISSAIENSRGGSMSGASAPAPNQAAAQPSTAGAPSTASGASGGSAASSAPSVAGGSGVSSSGTGTSPAGESSAAPARSGSAAAPASATAGSAGAPSASAQGGGVPVSSSGAPNMGTPVMPQSSSTNLGDASTASVSSGADAGSNGGSAPAAQPGGNQGGSDTKLHERIQDLQGYVPQDQGGAGGGFNIQLNHTAD